LSSSSKNGRALDQRLQQQKTVTMNLGQLKQVAVLMEHAWLMQQTTPTIL